MCVCLLVLQTTHDKNTKRLHEECTYKNVEWKNYFGISHNFHGKLRLTTCGLWTNVRS